MEKQHGDFFLDSGAFSVWKRGESIDTDAYIAYIKETWPHITQAATMDIIGDAEGSYKNHKYMESKGVTPMPIYHLEEPLEHLTRYMNEGYKYIGIGGLLGGIVDKSIFAKLDKCFDMICDKDGWPKVKIHGYGLSALQVLKKYPWYSVDFSTWIKVGAFGAIYIPKMKSAEFDYQQIPLKVFFSDKSPTQREDGKHYTTLTTIEKVWVDAYIAQKGFTVEQLTTKYIDRQKMMAIFFLDLQENYRMEPFKRISRWQFDKPMETLGVGSNIVHAPDAYGKPPSAAHPKIKIYFVINSGPGTAKPGTNLHDLAEFVLAKKMNVLISFIEGGKAISRVLNRFGRLQLEATKDEIR